MPAAPGRAPAIVDVAMNVFGKPLQTALSALSLLRACGRHIDTLFFQFEPFGSSFDAGLPYAVAEYLQEGLAAGDHAHKIVTYQPTVWMQRNVPDIERLGEDGYRLAIRYQYAWEKSDKPFLLTVHNDVFVLRDLVGAMLAETAEKDARGNLPFAVGGVGQCWNCPARLQELVDECAPGQTACTPAAYADFQPDFSQLACLYERAALQGVFVRPYQTGWRDDFEARPWPLPECRVNEWACLVNMELARPATVPNGSVPAFGAFGQCGEHLLDTAVPWFRGMNGLGLRARHLDVNQYMKHWVGTGKKTRKKHNQAEDNARLILERHFPDFVAWARKKNNGLFV